MNDKYTNSLIISAIVGVIGITTMTIGGELYSPFKDALKNIFSHHWIGKGVISFVGFFIVALLLSYFTSLRNLGTRTLLLLLTWVAILSTVILLGFFIYEFFAHL